MITPVLDFLLESKGKLEASKRAFDSMLMETMELLFSIASKTDPHAAGAWQSAKENGKATILDLRNRSWGALDYEHIYYVLSGRTVNIRVAPYLYFHEGGVEAFYFDDDGSGGNGWYLFSEAKRFQTTGEDEHGTKEENGNMH